MIAAAPISPTPMDGLSWLTSGWTLRLIWSPDRTVGTNPRLTPNCLNSIVTVVAPPIPAANWPPPEPGTRRRQQEARRLAARGRRQVGFGEDRQQTLVRQRVDDGIDACPARGDAAEADIGRHRRGPDRQPGRGLREIGVGANRRNRARGGKMDFRPPRRYCGGARLNAEDERTRRRHRRLPVDARRLGHGALNLGDSDPEIDLLRAGDADLVHDLVVLAEHSAAWRGIDLGRGVRIGHRAADTTIPVGVDWKLIAALGMSCRISLSTSPKSYPTTT